MVHVAQKGLVCMLGWIVSEQGPVGSYWIGWVSWHFGHRQHWHVVHCLNCLGPFCYDHNARRGRVLCPRRLCVWRGETLPRWVGHIGLPEHPKYMSVNATFSEGPKGPAELQSKHSGVSMSGVRGRTFLSIYKAIATIIMRQLIKAPFILFPSSERSIAWVNLYAH